MIEAELMGNRGTARGVTQWDYGQILHFTGEYIADGTEVNFYQKKLSGLGYIKDNCVQIPDVMLQNADSITAYIYVRDSDSGETVLIIWIPIIRRPKPENYILPDTEEYKRLLPVGGGPGQVPIKQQGEGYDVSWGYRADGIKYDAGYVQLMSGSIPVGERVRITKEEREIELANDGANIKWRYTDCNDWTVLVSLQSLTGPQGPTGITPKFEIRNGHLFAKYE